MKIALDVVMAAIILIAVWSGYKKGVIMGIGGIIVLIIAVVLGNALSNAYSQEVVTAMQPFASGYTDKLLRESVYEELEIEDSEYSIDDLLKSKPELNLASAERALKKLGFSDDAAAGIAMDAVRYTNQNGVRLSEGLTDTVCSKAAYSVGFLLFFLLTAIILTVIGNISNLSYRIPYIGIANEIGGALCGLAEGVIFCMILAWALRFTGMLIPHDVLQETYLTEFFMTKNYIVSYLGI